MQNVRTWYYAAFTTSRTRTGPNRPQRPAPSAAGDPEPRGSALIAVLATGGLYLALPRGLTVGPR